MLHQQAGVLPKICHLAEETLVLFANLVGLCDADLIEEYLSEIARMHSKFLHRALSFDTYDVVGVTEHQI
jgi:hypothetical protein